MWQLQSSAAHLTIPFPVKPPRPSHSPALISRRCTVSMASMAENRIPAPPISKPGLPKSNDLTVTQSLMSSSAPPIVTARALGFRPTPELGLLSLLFVLSMAIGSIISLGVISIPTMIAFRRLAASADALSKVVQEEVPGTLSALKLSGLEINDLTKQLSNLKQKITGGWFGKKDRSTKST